MSEISSISASGAAAGSVKSQPSITSLQSQMSLYSQYANATGQAGADYKALQFAIQTHNITNAQAALARLRRDAQASSQTPSLAANTSTPADSDGNHDGSSGGATGVNGNLVNITA